MSYRNGRVGHSNDRDYKLQSQEAVWSETVRSNSCIIRCGKEGLQTLLGVLVRFFSFFPVLGTEFRTFPTYGRHVLFYQATLLAHPGLGGSKQRDCELCLHTAFGSSSPLGTKH